MSYMRQLYLKITLDLYTYEYNFSILNTDETICVFFIGRELRHVSLGWLKSKWNQNKICWRIFNFCYKNWSSFYFFLQSKNIKTVLKTPPLWGEDNLLGTMTAKFQVDTSKHLFSLLSMIGPSPDWCVGEWEGAEVPPGNLQWTMCHL